MLFSLNYLHSQSSINFCASVESNGYCLFNNSKFFLSPDSVNEKIYMRVHNSNSFVGTSKITFKVYAIGKGGEEKYENMMVENVQAAWTYAWLSYAFKVGKYNVKIFNEKDQLMCNKALEIFN